MMKFFLSIAKTQILEIIFFLLMIIYLEWNGKVNIISQISISAF